MGLKKPVRSGRMLLLMKQQPALSFQSAGITCEFAIAANNPVAGDDNWDGIFTIGQANCSRVFCRTRPDCNFDITRGFAISNLAYQFPYAMLKFASGWCEFQVKLQAFPFKILIELLHALYQYVRHLGGSFMRLFNKDYAFYGFIVRRDF